MNTARIISQGLAGLATSLFAAALMAAAVPEPIVGGDEELQELEEVEVTGTRLWKMRQQMVELEDEFNARFNELNENDDFDVTCRMEAPLGTRLKKRNCKVAFYEEAEAEYAQAALRGEIAIDPQLVAFQRQDEYRAATLKIINGDARLRRLIEQRINLEKTYEAERKRRFKGRWILFE